MGVLKEEMASGGRIKKAPGGLMNLGGMEKDYRQTGGFVPIGKKEKADDVPARLSKNEFVMTADAVRAAGGGNINKGAQRMYNTMKQLEGKRA
jgi:predicted house-cleaning NTP pyrophosphatase (Maf/HAM1 superfamily)